MFIVMMENIIIPAELTYVIGNGKYQITSTRVLRKTAGLQRRWLDNHFKPNIVLRGCAKFIIYFILIHECEFELKRLFKENQHTQEECPKQAYEVNS